MTIQISELADYGWSNFFTSQLDADDLENGIPARVKSVHRNQIHVIGVDLDRTTMPYISKDGEGTQATVGDWLLLEPETFRPKRLLDRKSIFKRKAVGSHRGEQLIAANVDTLFIVASCNFDFNLARLERYLSLAHEAQVTPVIILTKADLVDDPDEFTKAVSALHPSLIVETIDARDAAAAKRLEPWCGLGQTVAFVGSSGVGKSTLINTLIGTDDIETRDVRVDDSKGRHTTTGRTLHRLPEGGWLIDTPGMREIQLTDVEEGIKEVFSDILEMAASCKFNNCGHNQEPGCAVRVAIEDGSLDAERLKRWQKLAAEETRNTETLAQRHNRDRGFGKMVKRAKQEKDRRRGD
ncbi:putative ribosome biogenesis GTPase RsgA [Rhodobiaceae bacterium]|nr:putative ribosome biogenesis GTPase RsgA [Rhodobiaceae bacterium]